MIQVYIRDRNKVYFSGKVDTLTSHNVRGDFDILENHANFLTTIDTYIILNKGLPNEQRFETTGGILKVLKNNLKVYLGL